MHLLDHSYFPVTVVEPLANGHDEIGVGIDLATITLA